MRKFVPILILALLAIALVPVDSYAGNIELGKRGYIQVVAGGTTDTTYACPGYKTATEKKCYTVSVALSAGVDHTISLWNVVGGARHRLTTGLAAADTCFVPRIAGERMTFTCDYPIKFLAIKRGTSATIEIVWSTQTP